VCTCLSADKRIHAPSAVQPDADTGLLQVSDNARHLAAGHTAGAVDYQRFIGAGGGGGGGLPGSRRKPPPDPPLPPPPPRGRPPPKPPPPPRREACKVLQTYESVLTG